MLTLYDYLPSQNAWKVRCLLRQLGVPYRTEFVSIFEGEGQRDGYLAISPTGAVPAIRLDDGRTLAESNAILWFLASGTAYLPDETFAAAKVLQWLSFEADYVQATIATLRHWVMTGKDAARPASLLNAKRAGSDRVLRVLDRALTRAPFLANDAYSIADIAVFAYVHRSREAGLDPATYRHLQAWIERVRRQPGFLDETHPYAIDPHSGRELP
jgi:glutathione S-transferase